MLVHSSRIGKTMDTPVTPSTGFLSSFSEDTRPGVTRSHPLLDLNTSEIKRASVLIRKLHRGEDLVFKAITLEEPPKDLILQYFKAQDNGLPFSSIPRMAFAAYYIKGTVCLFNLIARNHSDSDAESICNNIC